MPANLNFLQLGFADSRRVAQVRLRSYAGAAGDLDKFETMLKSDVRARDGDFIVASNGSEDVGTATSLSMPLWMRGSPVPCQCVAWVGTIKTMRRARRGGPSTMGTGHVAEGSGPSAGVASALMSHVLKIGRDRQQVVSALMPFRTSFYEHFGFGLAERRAVWTIPMDCLPQGDATGFRYASDADLPALLQCSKRSTEAGRCDLEKTPESWQADQSRWDQGFMIVDAAGPNSPKSAADGAIASYMLLGDLQEEGSRIANLIEQGAHSLAALRRQLHLLATLRDQYDAVRLAVPADLPLNRMLAHNQLPHRPVTHPAAKVELQTRMQIRVLDHRRLIESLRLLSEGGAFRGSATIAVCESEGHQSRFRIEIENGRCAVADSPAAPGATLKDSTWASMVSGELNAHTAAKLGLIEIAEPAALDLLAALSDGPVPFCNEYF
jgi:predicted acetyltransferase